MANRIEDILSVRKMTHGPFAKQAALSQALKNAVRQFDGWEGLDGHQKESIDMIFHKVARAVTGDANYPDHWDDMAGYALLSAKELNK
jgi:hypothetical protein